jgi:helix-turn-helix protein
MTRARVDLIEVADVAKILGRTPAAIRARVVRGQIPVAVVTPRGARLFRRSDIDAILRRMTAP